MAPETNGPDSQEMILNVAIVGGGTAGAEFLKLATKTKLGQFRFNILGLANTNPDSEGVQLARARGVPFITSDFRELYDLPGLDVILELTGDEAVRDEIDRTRPRHVRLVDTFGASLFWELYRAQQEIIQQRTTMREHIEAQHTWITQIFNSLPYEIMVLDADLVIQDANGVFLERNEVTLDEIRGKQCYEVDQHVRGHCRVDTEGCPAMQALRSGEATPRVREFLDETGQKRWASIVASPLHDADGEVVGIVEATRDISHRISLEEKLAAAESRRQQLTELAPEAIFIKNLNGQYIEINQALARLYGRTKEEILGKTDLQLLDRKTAEAFRASDREVLRSKQALRLEGTLDLGGQTVHLSTTKFPLLDPQGEPEAICAISLDVTEAKEQELALIQTSEYLRNVVDNSPVIIMTTDLDGRIVSFNPGAEESLGYSKEEVLGQPARDFYPDPEERDELLRRVIRDGSVRDVRTSLVRKDGTPVPVSITLSQLKDSAGEMIGTVGMSKDISRRKVLMEQVMQSERLAAVGRLASGVAHEINNPLAVIGEIAGYLQELIEADPEVQDAETRTELAEGLPKITNQIHRCRTITHRMLTFARKSEAAVELADVNGALDEILPFVEKEARLARVTIHRDYAERLPRVRIEEMQLQEIFINLINNAIQALDERNQGGDIWIRTEQRAAGRVVVSFRDNGPGISEEVQDRLFDPFVTTKPPGKGTGLGLSICYGIVKRYDGQILVDSTPGEGTTFEVILSAAPA